ncbi:MAG: hypothetical protein QNJ19_16955 [Woeseiaceae bacterium]|nr:hypothetical protein [Woeseiaceae bacterium]
MKRKLTAIVIIGTALLAGAPEAQAHKKHHHHGHPAYHDGYAYHGYHYKERHRLPRWLRRHDHFRAWYRHTPLRYNLRLGWDELYSIFIWERRYSNHKRYHRYGKVHRDYGYYRKYWKKRHGHRDWHGYRDRHGDRDRRGHRDHRRDRDRRHYRY